MRAGSPGIGRRRRELQVAVVADDLTGAMDVAGPFAAAGLRTLVRLEAHATVAPAKVDVLSCSTESRHAAPDVAAEKVEAAVRSLTQAAAKILLKKIDSTLRGNVAAEIAAALRACGRRHVLVAPAAPMQGRTLRNGEVFVRGIPLAESEFARDLRSPPIAMSMPRLLASPGARFDVHVWPRGAAMALQPGEGPHAYVADAEIDGDLDRIAEFALAHRDELLLVGSTGIGAALARQWLRPGAATAGRPPLAPDAGRILFIVGSRTALAADQLARLRAIGGEEIVVSSSDRTIDASTRRADPMAGILVMRPEIGGGTAAEEVARGLGRAAVDLVRRSDVTRLVIVGGDTARGVLAAFGLNELALIGEIMPGIPVARVIDRHRPILVVSKAGGFGDTETLSEIARRLGA